MKMKKIIKSGVLLTLGKMNPILTCLGTDYLVQMENESPKDKQSSTKDHVL